MYGYSVSGLLSDVRGSTFLDTGSYAEQGISLTTPPAGLEEEGDTELNSIERRGKLFKDLHITADINQTSESGGTPSCIINIVQRSKP